MPLGQCKTCLAADNADPDNLRALVRWQQTQLDRLTSDVDTFALKAARVRIAELEETIVRLNQRITRKQAS